jgi:hypothetical protein
VILADVIRADDLVTCAGEEVLFGSLDSTAQIEVLQHALENAYNDYQALYKISRDLIIRNDELRKAAKPKARVRAAKQ